MSERPMRAVEIAGATWSFVDAWRAPSGLGLGYFLAPDPADDRRVALTSGTEVGELGEDSVRELYASAAPLTATERRFMAEGGEAWLAVSTGPVWGEGAAASLTGVRVRCLTSERPVVEVPGGTLEALSDDGLRALVAPEP